MSKVRSPCGFLSDRYFRNYARNKDQFSSVPLLVFLLLSFLHLALWDLAVHIEGRLKKRSRDSVTRIFSNPPRDYYRCLAGSAGFLAALKCPPWEAKPAVHDSTGLRGTKANASPCIFMKTGLQANLFNFSVIARARSLARSFIRSFAALLRGCTLLFARGWRNWFVFRQSSLFHGLTPEERVIPRVRCVGREVGIRSGLTARKVLPSVAAFEQTTW